MTTPTDDFRRGYEQAKADAAALGCTQCRRGVPVVDGGMHHREASGHESICRSFAIRALRPAEPAAAPSGKACDTCGGRGQTPACDVMYECDACGGTGRADGR